MFSTEAIILRHRFIVFKIALWTFPIEKMQSFLILLLVDAFNPIFYALEVHWDAATTTSPNEIFSMNKLRAYDAMHVVMTTLTFCKFWRIKFFLLSLSSVIILLIISTVRCCFFLSVFGYVSRLSLFFLIAFLLLGWD